VPGFLNTALLGLSALAAGLAVLVGLGFGLLTLGCLGAFALFLYEGRLGLAATQVPAILAAGVAAWLCRRWMRRELAVFDSVVKEGAPDAPESLSTRAKLRLVGLNAAVLILCLLAAVPALEIFVRLFRGPFPATG